MKIYFVHQGLLSFVKKDLDILESKYQLRAVNNINFRPKTIADNLNGVFWSDVVFCWFCSLRYVVPILLGKLFRKKILIVAGGYEVANLPQIGYGGMQGNWRTWLHKSLFSLAHHIICISKSNMYETNHNVNIPLEKLLLIYHGFNRAEIIRHVKKTNVITVGRVSRENLMRKGLKLFIEAARYFPEIPFFLIGALDHGIEEEIANMAPPNLRLTGFVSDNELQRHLESAKVYVQASMHEGFGCAVAEAMLHECIPVVSNCFALPEVVGDAGHLFVPGSLNDLQQKISLALNNGDEVGRKARARVEKHFSLEARRDAFLSLIESL
jgi:glycosyltransferase involved in cell wall biosynthesis